MNMMERMISIDLGPEPTIETDLNGGGEASMSVNGDADFRRNGGARHQEEAEAAETIEERSVSSFACSRLNLCNYIFA